MKRKIIPYNPKLKELARDLRNNSTKSEIILWLKLKGKQMYGYDFHRQKPIDNYIVDFFCNELMLAIEVDGYSHQLEDVYFKDVEKEKKLQDYGISVLRFTDNQVLNEIDNVIRAVEFYIEEYEKHTPNPSQEGNFEEKPITILSTKKLLPKQKQEFIDAKINLIDEDFIEVKNKDFELVTNNEMLLFTSQNAVKSILYKKEELHKFPVLCVGEKTKELLENNGFCVLECESYAKDLTAIISNKYSNKSFTFFCGTLRLETIPEFLSRKSIKHNIIEVYETILTPKKITKPIDGILFFSPSGVKSYVQENKIHHEICFCIGETTAEALKNITEKIIIAEKPSVENVVEKAIRFYNKN